MDGTALPVAAGLIIGIMFTGIFAIFGNESLASAGRVYFGISSPDAFRTEYHLQVNHIDKQTLARKDMSMLKHLIDNTPSDPHSPAFEDEITKQQAKQLMKPIQFSNVSSYIDHKYNPDSFRVYMALVQPDWNGTAKYYGITLYTTKLPDSEISSLRIIQASPPR